MKAVGDKKAEAHAGYVEDSLSYDKAHREEEIGGWEEGNGGQTQAKEELPVMAVSGGEGEEREGEKAGKGGQGQQVAGVGEGGNGGNSAHGILGTQLRGTQ